MEELHADIEVGGIVEDIVLLTLKEISLIFREEWRQLNMTLIVQHILH